MGPMLCKAMLAVTPDMRSGLAAGQRDRGHHLVAARQATGPPGDLAPRAEHEHSRRPPDVEPPDQIQPVGHVEFQVCHAVGAGGHVGKQLPGGGGAVSGAAPVPPRLKLRPGHAKPASETASLIRCAVAWRDIRADHDAVIRA